MSKVRIRYGPWTPWSLVTYPNNISNLGGIAGDLYSSVSKALNEEFEITLQEDFIFGSLGSDGNWSGMLGAMQRNETDISGPYFVTEDRSTVVEFSAPIGFAQLAIVTGLEHGNRDPFILLRIFSLTVWLLIILSIIVATAAAAFMYSMLPAPKKRTNVEASFKYAWMFYGTLLGKDYGNSKAWYLRHLLLSLGFRILLSVWLVGAVLVLMYTYQGAITSTLAADKLKPIMETLYDMDKNKAVKPSTFGSSITSICFEKLKGTNLHSLYTRVFQNLKVNTKSDYPEWLDDVESGKLVFVAETSFMKSFVGKRFEATGKCGLRVIPTDFCPAYIAIAFRKMFRQRVKNVFNQRNLWYNEGDLAYRHRIKSSLSYDICTSGNSGVAKPLELKNLLGAFLVYAIGVSFSVFVFIVEKIITWKKFQERNKINPNAKNNIFF